MNGARPVLERSIYLLGSGYRKDVAQRLLMYDDWAQVGAMLPVDARLLIHVWPLHLGIGRQTVTDNMFGGQLGLAYGRLGSIPAVHEKLKEMGVTHVSWREDFEDMDSLAGELLFRTYAHLYTGERLYKNGWTVAPVPRQTPAPRSDRVLVVGCGYPYKTGLYTLEELSVPRPTLYVPMAQFTPSKTSPTPAMLIDEASYLAIENTCPIALNISGFTSLGPRRATPAMTLYARTIPTP